MSEDVVVYVHDETKTERVHFAQTEYGFEYGSAKIERLLNDNGRVVIGIETPRVAGMQIAVTRTGKVRIFDSRGEWSAP